MYLFLRPRTDGAAIPSCFFLCLPNMSFCVLRVLAVFELSATLIYSLIIIIIIIISRSKYTPRSQADVDAVMWQPPSENTPLSMRCNRRVAVHQRNSVLLGFSCKRLEAVQRTASSIHASTAAFRTAVLPCGQKYSWVSSAWQRCRSPCVFIIWPTSVV